MALFSYVNSAYVRHPRHGPLPAILVLMTTATGVVDAVSILGLGRVFVSTMTGNVVFIGFALGGAPDFSLWGLQAAVAAFLAGAACGGWAVTRYCAHRGRLLRNTLLTQVFLITAALLVSIHLPDFTDQLAILALLALALGMQNAVVRNLAVPDLPTTLLGRVP